MKSQKNIFNTLYALIATGGPGGTRFVVFTLFVYLFDSSFFDFFLKDVFLVLSLNVVFCQSYTIFYYKKEYREKLYTLLSLSAVSLFLSLIVLMGIQLQNQQLSYAWVLLIALHFYFFLRIYLLANSLFKECAELEFLSFIFFASSVLCVSHYNLDSSFLIFSYACSLLMSGGVILAKKRRRTNEEINFWDGQLFIKACNFSVSNFSGSAILFLIPQLLAMLELNQFISVVSLSLTVALVIYLIPRTFATKVLPKITISSFKEIQGVNRQYNMIVLLSSLVMFLGLLIYNYMVIGELNNDVILLLLLLSLFMSVNQFNSVYSHAIVIYGDEAQLRNIHIKSVIILTLLLGVTFFLSSKLSPLVLVAVLFLSLSLSFFIRGILFYKSFTELELCKKKPN